LDRPRRTGLSGHCPRAGPCPTQTPQRKPLRNPCRRHKPSRPAP
jgi:hypothetical protein